MLDEFVGAPWSARTLLLAGGPGFGKTSLWEAGIDRAQRSGATVLVARPSEAETQLSFAALSDLLESVDDTVLSALPAPQQNALEVALLRAEPSDRPPEVRAIAAGFLAVLRELASREPLMVAVDDVQWLDAASAGALRFAQRRLNDETIAFLLTERTGTGTVWFGDERSVRVDVGGVSMGAARLLLAERLDFEPPRRLVRQIFESTDGNPFFTLELARTLRDADPRVSSDQPLAVPNELGMLLRERLSTLSEGAKAAALGAALASDPTTGLIEALLGAEAATAALNELVAASVVGMEGDRIRFTHPLLASTVTSGALPQPRRAMQGELSRLVVDPVARARHLARASAEPDRDTARLIEDAAVVARARGGWDTAADLLEQARELTPEEDADDRQRRAIAAAEHHAHSGDRSSARTTIEGLLAGPLPRTQRANALRLLARVSADDENFAGAIAVYQEALEYVDEPLLEATIEDELSFVTSTTWDATGATHAKRALEVAEACDDTTLISRSLAACAMADFMFGRGLDWSKIERALDLEDYDAVMPLQVRPSTVAGLAHLYVGNHAEAREQLTAAWRRAADHGDEGDLSFVLVWLSWLEARSADFETAASLADQAETLAELTGSQSMRAFAVAERAFVAAHEGDVERARAASAEAIALGATVGFFLPQLWGCATLTLLELSIGNPEAAWRACEELTIPIETFGVGEPILPFFLPDAIEALLALGRLDRAAPLISSLEGRGRELDRPWALALGARCRGLLLAAQGDLGGAEAALAAALAEHERLDMPFERGRTLLAKGLVERRTKQRSKARASFTAAIETFERVGARLWRDRARDELTRVSGRRPRSSSELTPTEQRVVELAAEGLSNKEIAEALFVSVHTVETHLSRAYSKLGVRSRSQLPRDAGTVH
jgi:DNA-binding CsgD family transcriptional regulator